MLASALATICPIAMMTFTSPDLDAVENRYAEYLNYEVRDSGIISEKLAHSWGAGKTAGKRFILLGPESGERVYLRVIEGEKPEPAFEPVRTFGWTTAEIIGTDAYTLSNRLKKSPFREETANRVIRLNFSDHITNFRVVGPDGEAMYLSQIDGDVPNMPFAKPRSFVDKIIMTVQTSKDPRASQIFYEDLFKVPGLAPFRIGAGRLHTVMLPGGCLVELDSPRPGTKERPVEDGKLPYGMSITTYYMDTLNRDDLTFVTPPHTYEVSPYGKRRAATVRGPSGELVELLEFKMLP